MSARQLSQLAGIAVSTITSIEAGVTPRYGTIHKLAEALGLRIDDILWPGDPLGLNDDIPAPNTDKPDKPNG